MAVSTSKEVNLLQRSDNSFMYEYIFILLILIIFKSILDDLNKKK